MKAFILAAGMGTRLRPLTDDKPKALVVVAGKPLIDHALQAILEAGISEVIVNVHHFADQLTEHVRNWDYPGLTVHISDERDRLMDTGGGIWKARPFLEGDEPFLVYNVDIISDIDISEMLRQHNDSGALATLAVRDRPTSRSLMLTAEGMLCGWQDNRTGEKKISFDAPHALLAFSGIHILSQEIWSFAPDTPEPESIIDIYLKLAANGEHIGSYRHDNSSWFDVGREEHISAIEDELAKRKNGKADGSNSLTRIFIGIAILLLLPFLLLTFFAIPAADDFYFSARASELNLMEYLSHFYSHYTGRVLPTVLFYFNPLHFGATSLYFLPLLLGLLFFSWSVYVVVPVFSGPRLFHKRLAITLGVLLVLLQFFPSTAQGFYWLSGMLFYTVPASLLLLFIRLLHLRFEVGRRCGFHLALALVIALLLPLGNEVIVVPSGLLVVLVLFKRLKERMPVRDILLITGGLLAGIVIQLLSPGNYSRMADFTSFDDSIPSVFRSLDPALKLWGLMLMNPLLWIASLLFIAGYKSETSGWKGFVSGLPLWIILPSAFLITILMYLPSEYVSGYIPWRVHNTGMVVFLLSWIIVLFRLTRISKPVPFPRWSVITLIIVALMSLGGDFQWKGTGSKPRFRGNIPGAWYDLVKQAPEYKTYWDQVMEVSKTSAGIVQVLDKDDIPESPYTIHFTTLTPNPGHELNEWYSLYFGLEAIEIAGEEPE